MEQLPRTALNPVVQQFPVFAHSPDRRAGEVDGPLIRGHAQYAIVFALDPPARRNATSVLVLKCLHDLELKIRAFLQKLFHPLFEFGFRSNVDTARRNDEIVDDESVDRVYVLPLPHHRPEIFHDFDRIELFHSNSP